MPGSTDIRGWKVEKKKSSNSLEFRKIVQGQGTIQGKENYIDLGG